MIPSLFIDGELNPESQWVLDGEGEAYPMWDGEPMAVIGGNLHKVSPRGHWIRVGISDKAACDAWALLKGTGEPPDGSYELCGPGIRGNKHLFDKPVLVRHAMCPITNLPAINYGSLDAYLEHWPYEGIVWHHHDGKRRAKLRKEEMGRAW